MWFVYGAIILRTAVRWIKPALRLFGISVVVW